MNEIVVQVFIIMYYTGADSFTEAMKIGCETYHTLKNVIKKKYGLDGKAKKLGMVFVQNMLSVH